MRVPAAQCGGENFLIWVLLCYQALECSGTLTGLNFCATARAAFYISQQLPQSRGIVAAGCQDSQTATARSLRALWSCPIPCTAEIFLPLIFRT
jgi:hypothetical protein